MAYHAKLSPSSAHRWSDCTASIGAQEGISDDGSEAARLGTCQHQLSAECLEHGHDPQAYLHRKMLFWAHPESESSGEDWEDELHNGGDGYDPSLVITHEVVVDQDMIDACSTYINFVRNVAETTGGTLFIEQQVPIGHITGEEDARGTSDVVLTTPTRLHTIDAKFGRSKVMAYDIIKAASSDVLTGEPTPEVAQMNLQLAMYLLGSLEKYGYMGDFTHVTATIVQPYLNHVSEFSCTVEELLALGEWLKARAEETRTNPRFSPSVDNCHFCRARFTCKAREEAVLSTALEGFEDVDTATPRRIKENQLGSLYAKTGMIIQWCKDVETRVYEELQSGRPVMRNDGVKYKLVAGKKGARQWANADEAEATMKKMRLKQEQMYTQSLISPSAAEKLAKAKKAKKGEPSIPPVIGPTQWSRLEALMVQSEGGPSIALETDPRPPIAPAVADFGDVDVPAAECSDLF